MKNFDHRWKRRRKKNRFVKAKEPSDSSNSLLQQANRNSGGWFLGTINLLKLAYEVFRDYFQ